MVPLKKKNIDHFEITKNMILRQNFYSPWYLSLRTKQFISSSSLRVVENNEDIAL